MSSLIRRSFKNFVNTKNTWKAKKSRLVSPKLTHIAYNRAKELITSHKVAVWIVTTRKLYLMPKELRLYTFRQSTKLRIKKFLRRLGFPFLQFDKQFRSSKKIQEPTSSSHSRRKSSFFKIDELIVRLLMNDLRG